MRLSWKLGRVSGIDLFLHPSALLWFFFGAQMSATPLESAVLVVALLGSIVLHELGHALMARQYGIDTADITLYIFGGVARLERMPRSSGPELLIALAGPAVNFAIVLALGAILALTSLATPWPLPLLVNILTINLGLGIFNLIPAFPMDGGRVLRALLSGWLGRVKATETAAALGRGLAIAGGLYFLVSGNYQAIILARFVDMAGSLELQQVRAEGRGLSIPGGFVNLPDPPPGCRWADSGNGILRPVPIMMNPMRRDRSWS